MKQFDGCTTFFDLGIDKKEERFVTLYCVMTEMSKKRNNITRLALQYLLNKENLSLKDQEIAKSILDDSFYHKPKLYSHCRLCSDQFERMILSKYSSQFKYWEICLPTTPYFPGSMMVYLKNRNESKKENFQDLNREELDELKYIISDLKITLNEKLFNGNLTGINVLFNQISKSQLCIHGHVELMLKKIDKLDLGCKLLYLRNYDQASDVINGIFDSGSKLLKTKEGIRINLHEIPYEEMTNYITRYENEIKKIINLGKALREGKKNIETQFEFDLCNKLSPAPANSVYLTDYRDRLFLSCVPEIMPPTISLNEIGDLTDDENMYLIKYNATTPNKDFSIMKKYSPLARPSSKISYEQSYTENVRVLTKNISKVLGE